MIGSRRLRESAHHGSNSGSESNKSVHDENWETDVPAGGYMSDAHPISWPIPADMPEVYFFLVADPGYSNGVQLSRRAHWLRVVKTLADPAERKKWQSGPVEDLVAQKGPWLKPQIAGLRPRSKARLRLNRNRNWRAKLRSAFATPGIFPLTRCALSFTRRLFGDVDGQLFLAGPRRKGFSEGNCPIGYDGTRSIYQAEVASRAALSLQLSRWNAPPIKLRP